MLFDTIQYWVFFAFTLAVVGSIPHKAGKAALIVLSYLFYGFWDVRFLLLLGGSTAANYVFGRLIELRKDPSRRLILAIAISFNLTLLAVFKYFNFFVASFASLFGLPESTLILNIALPVGISFFTFEGVAYVTDVYRRNICAVRDPVDFALFVSFFPHLVAGPIIRPANFFPQTEVPATFAAADMNWGFVQILKGLLKKTVFADFFG
jgi:alginate O-acetyltransferase complex protein AlgI